jgi:trehalose 6-phosphate synthase
MEEPKWDKDRLYQLVREKLGDYLFVVISNREPYIHSFSGNELRWTFGPGGVTAALDPVMQASGGTWVAWGAGQADKAVVDDKDRVKVPPDNPQYTLKRVWLTPEEIEGFYNGFCSSGIWPLIHQVYVCPFFSKSHWEIYQRVNNRYAQALLDELAGKPALALFNDIHVALVSRIVKESNPNIVSALFWHEPWPHYEAFRILPWQKEILDGLLSHDLLGFHLREHCEHFLDCAHRSLGAQVDHRQSTVTWRGLTTQVRVFPISVDFQSISQLAQGDEVRWEMAKLREEKGLNYPFIGVGMDRIDYTKGILERIKALDLLLEKYPQYRGKLSFFQLGQPSRTGVKEYQAIGEQLDLAVKKVNKKYQDGQWQPIIYFKGYDVSRATCIGVLRLANFCVVSSLHDGMNLVAKEFVASRVDGDGVLILSQFAGAAAELQDAVLINPFTVEEFAEKIKEAIEMPKVERQRRMKIMRETVNNNNIYQWAGSIISSIMSIAGI